MSDVLPVISQLKKPKHVYNFARRLQTEFLPLLKQESAYLQDLFPEGIELSVVEDILTRSEKLLEDVAARSQAPLTVSLIGTFSSGKTATLCALVNKADLLPMEQGPETGNVVELRIVPPSSSADVRFAECILFSVNELVDMLRNYCEALKLNYVLPDEIDEYLTKLPELRNELKLKLRELWQLFNNNQSSLGQIETLRKFASLYWLVSCTILFFKRFGYTREGPLGKFVFPRDIDLLRAAISLDMQWSANECSPSSIEEYVSKHWAQVPSTLQAVVAEFSKGQVNPLVLRAFFPLIRRVVITEELALDTEEWNNIDGLSFLDFPGLNSGNQRDVYLSQKELSEAHVNLLFLLASRPNATDIQELTQIVTEAKKEHEDLTERIIPIINFFDAYQRLPVLAGPAESTSILKDQAQQRIEHFFSHKVGSVERGFKVFDQLLSFLPSKVRGNYHLLSPMASFQVEVLESKDRPIKEVFERNKECYGQLIMDLNAAKSLLGPEAKEIKRRNAQLMRALEEYLVDGGVEYLRQTIALLLTQKGSKMITEDAIIPLTSVLSNIESNLLVPLKENDVNMDLDSFERGEVRAKIIELWNTMRAMMEEWTREIVNFELICKSEEGKMISPLQLSEAFVTDLVLGSEFWQPLDYLGQNPKAVALSELSVYYHQMITEVDLWLESTTVDAVYTTLQMLDQVAVESADGAEHSIKTSLSALRHVLHNEIVSRSSNINNTKIEELDGFFTLTSLQQDLLNALKQRELDDRKQQKSTYASDYNDKAPFNERQDIRWTSYEVMKIQYQMIWSLKQRADRYLSFYTSNFAQQLKHILKEYQTNRLYDAFVEYSSDENLFDNLAKVQRDVDSSAQRQNRALRAARANEAASKILNQWKLLTARSI